VERGTLAQGREIWEMEVGNLGMGKVIWDGEDMRWEIWEWGGGEENKYEDGRMEKGMWGWRNRGRGWEMNMGMRMRGWGDEEVGECGEGDMGRTGMFRVFGECSWTAPNAPEHIFLIPISTIIIAPFLRFSIIPFCLLYIPLSVFSLCHPNFTYSIFPHL
jgi:hypothetical protein